MRSCMLLLSLIFSVKAWSDPGLKLLIGKAHTGLCRAAEGTSFQRVQNNYAFSPNELVLSVRAYKDVACKNMIEINRYKMTCVFSNKDEYAACTHTGRGRSLDDSNWETLPVSDSPGEPLSGTIKVKVKAAKGGHLEITTIFGEAEPAAEILK